MVARASWGSKSHCMQSGSRKHLPNYYNQAWWSTPLLWAIGKQKQISEFEAGQIYILFETSQGYTVRSCLKKIFLILFRVCESMPAYVCMCKPEEDIQSLRARFTVCRCLACYMGAWIWTWALMIYHQGLLTSETFHPSHLIELMI